MIISELNGGLGDQMSHYATAKLIAKKNNVKFLISPYYLLAFRFYRKWNRDPEILNFKLRDEVIASKKDVRKFIYFSGISYIDMYLRRFKLFEKNIYRLCIDDEKNIPSLKNAYLLGSLHGCLFAEIKKDLIKEFELKEKCNIKKILNLIKNENSVSVHIRRGDLLYLKDGYILPIDYYKKAVNYLKGEGKNLKFYIFSDDIDWCEKNFDWLNNKKFVKGNSVAEDFELMKNCKYHILANSSLSWWVGYLQMRSSGKVICPKYFGLLKNCKGVEEYYEKKN